MVFLLTIELSDLPMIKYTPAAGLSYAFAKTLRV